MTTSELKEKVNLALNEIRPFLNEDGGDIEVLELTKDNTAVLQFTGACKTCSMNSMTFANGVEEAIRRNVPEVKKIVTK